MVNKPSPPSPPHNLLSPDLVVLAPPPISGSLQSAPQQLHKCAPSSAINRGSRFRPVGSIIKCRQCGIMVQMLAGHECFGTYNCVFRALGKCHRRTAAQHTTKRDCVLHMFDKHFRFDDARITRTTKLITQLCLYGTCDCGFYGVGMHWIENHVWTLENKCPLIQANNQQRGAPANLSKVQLS